MIVTICGMFGKKNEMIKSLKLIFIAIQKVPWIEITPKEYDRHYILSLKTVMLKFLRIRHMILESILTFHIQYLKFL